MKRIALAAALLGAIIFAFAGTALAGGGYGSQPGYSVANANTPCAGHGAFGAIGENGYIANFGNASPDGHPGANGTQTGINNSSLCGNR
jgi:hypothetical protein